MKRKRSLCYDNIFRKPCYLYRISTASRGNAHDFSLITPALEKKSLADFAGKKKVLSIIPSIDTGICSMQTRHFNKTLSDLEDTVVLTVSVDLPFAQGKWCAAEGLDNAIMLSDYFDHSSGKLTAS